MSASAACERDGPGMRRLLVTFGTALCLAGGPCLAKGFDRIVAADGNSLRLGQIPVRLHGIDAPDLHQTCAEGWPAGRLAQAALAALIAGRPVSCRQITLDRYDRSVARCSVDGNDLGAAMVAKGWAWASRRDSLEYLPEEMAARTMGLGVHAHSCQLPEAVQHRR